MKHLICHICGQPARWLDKGRCKKCCESRLTPEQQAILAIGEMNREEFADLMRATSERTKTREALLFLSAFIASTDCEPESRDRLNSALETVARAAGAIE